uniref:Uncharacterized protein n=1 Tax=Romanomermis culicivorax TaxID=13658 RepID=A0A915KHM1_ROMCU
LRPHFIYICKQPFSKAVKPSRIFICKGTHHRCSSDRRPSIILSLLPRPAPSFVCHNAQLV